jgi:DNA primase catalytic core
VTSRSELEYQTQRIKDCVDVVTAIGGYVRLRKAGREYIGLCPFHPERTPSFHVNPSRKSWKCFGCGEGGDVFDFIAKIERIDFTEARKLVANRAGIPIISRKLTEPERREWLRQRRQDEADTERRDALVELLRTRRTRYFRAYHRLRRRIVSHGTDSPGCDFLMDACETYEARYQALDAEIERIEGLPVREFRKLLAGKSAEVAA